MAGLMPRMSSLLRLGWTVLCVAPGVVFGGWLLFHIYLEDGGAQAADEVGEGDDPALLPVPEDLFHRLAEDEEDISRDHFHILDTPVEVAGQTLCPMCHGTYPHGKDEKLRALLNLHVGFMDCAVCHMGKEPEADRRFAWIDRESGELSFEPDGGFGVYPAKISLLMPNARGEPEVVRPVAEESAEAYLEVRHLYTPDQNTEAKAMLHERLSTEPVFCSDCHARDSYVDFDALGFTRSRAAALRSGDVAAMIEKYDTFYMPPAIDFGPE